MQNLINRGDNQRNHVNYYQGNGGHVFNDNERRRIPQKKISICTFKLVMIIIITICILGLIAFTVYKCWENDHLDNLNNELRTHYENILKDKKKYLMSKNISFKTNQINDDFNITEACLRSDEYIAINVCEKQKVNQERSFNKTIKDLSDSKTESMKSCENGKNDIKQYLMSRNISFKTNETNVDFNLSEPFQRKLAYIITNIYDEENLLHEEGLKKVLLALKNDFTYYYLEQVKIPFKL